MRLRRVLSENGYLAVLIPFVLYLGHILVFRRWIVDDAGIYFVYARNLAHGYGLVSQPGATAVEGFSSFIWVVLLSLFHLLGLFDPIITPKILSALLVLWSFFLVLKILRLVSNRYVAATAFTLTLAALTTPMAIWTTSGLENPLNLFLTLLLWYELTRFDHAEISGGEAAALIAVVAALLGMTRPDGVLYFFAYPLVFITGARSRARSNRESTIEGSCYVLVYSAMYLGFLAGRFLYFDDLLPNPYYQKGGPSVTTVMDLLVLRPEMVSKACELWDSVLPWGGGLLLAVTAVATVSSVTMKRFTRDHSIALSMVVFPVIVYLLLPRDWMGEYRFATPFFIPMYAYVFMLVSSLPILFTRRVARILALTLVALSVGSNFLRTRSFATRLTVPFTATARTYVRTFGEYASQLGSAQSSLLLPDVGAAFYYSSLRIYDLGGLADRTIAKTLGKDQAAFYDYVFDTIKPTFIHTHSVWAYRARFDEDSRFRRDYVPIHENIDASIVTMHGVRIYSGDYVRRDAVGDRLDELRALPTYRKLPSRAARRRRVEEASVLRFDSAGTPRRSRPTARVTSVEMDEASGMVLGPGNTMPEGT